jgi:hypothetical protein
MKPSEIFEGEKSSLRKTFNEAVENEEKRLSDILDEFYSLAWQDGYEKLNRRSQLNYEFVNKIIANDT